MKRRCVVCGAVWFGVLAVGLTIRADDLPNDQAAESSLLRAAGGDGFRIHRTRHFSIAYNTDPDVLLDFVTRVEGTYNAVQKFLSVNGLAHTALKARLEILFFATTDQFSAYAAGTGANVSGAAGFYSPETNRAVFFDAAGAPRVVELDASIEELQRRLRDRKKVSRKVRKKWVKDLSRLRNQRNNFVDAINELVVQHEVAHQVLFNCGLHTRGAMNPVWLVEGLACLFEPPLNTKGAGLARVNTYRLGSLRRALSVNGDALSARPTDLQNAFKHKRLVRPMQLIADRRLFDTTRPDVEISYAEAWSLVFYLQRKHRDKLAQYLLNAARRPVGRTYSPVDEFDAFEHVFGPLDANFENGWIRFMLQQRYSERTP